MNYIPLEDIIENPDYMEPKTATPSAPKWQQGDDESEPSFDITKVGQLDTSEWLDDSPNLTPSAIQECMERIEASNEALLVYLNAGHKAAREAASMLAKKTIRLNKRALSSLPTL